MVGVGWILRRRTVSLELGGNTFGLGAVIRGARRHTLVVVAIYT